VPEGTAYRLPKRDKAKYPQIICANEEEYKKGAEPFYTNSTQLPVNFTDDIFEAIELQNEIQTKYTGGVVLHIFAGERVNDYNTVKVLVRKVCENFHLGEHSECPRCGLQSEIYSRVVGYLRPVKQWNKGKKQEFKLRKTFRT
jgi:ribonucleoside-triphosphate reductase